MIDTGGWIPVNTALPECEDCDSIGVWLLIDDPDYPEFYTRVGGYWLNKMGRKHVDDEETREMTPEESEELTGFYTADDNYLTQEDDVVAWQYLPAIPAKSAELVSLGERNMI